MNTSELLAIRLYNQLLSAHHLKEPHEVVSWMGAMQSQSLELAKWAIGVRLQDKTVKDIEEALNTGKVIRTHILRPTWHFVSAEDIHWMSELSKPRLMPVCRSSTKSHGADEAIICRAVPVLEKIISGGKHLTKQEIEKALLAEKIKVDDIHLTQIISRAEIEGILCNGRLRGNKHTYTSLCEWVPRKQTLHREEALARLARTFFTSHGPATIQDFTWWSGLTLTDCKLALELIKADFISETINDRECWMKNDIKTPPANELSVLLLPPFDEYVVSYKDRSEIIEDTHYSKVMTKNGLFSPTVMLNGEIVGSWTKKTGCKTELSFFKKTPERIQRKFNPEIKRLERFYSV